MMNKQEGHPDIGRLKIVAKSIERAVHLVRQLLLFSRLSSGAMGFLGKPYQLKELAAMARSVLDE